MALVVGLGNPGVRYRNTRHNLGFMVLDRLVPLTGWKGRFQGEFASAEVAGSAVHLLKPQTYMNQSGTSVRAAVDFFKVPSEEILVVHDELDLEFGRLKLKFSGGEAGNNGLKSISKHLGTRDYYRLRLGIGKPPAEFRGSGADFVLQAFAPAEAAELEDFLVRGVEAVERFIADGPSVAMNEINRK